MKVIWQVYGIVGTKHFYPMKDCKAEPEQDKRILI